VPLPACPAVRVLPLLPPEGRLSLFCRLFGLFRRQDGNNLALHERPKRQLRHECLKLRTSSVLTTSSIHCSGGTGYWPFSSVFTRNNMPFTFLALVDYRGTNSTWVNSTGIPSQNSGDTILNYSLVRRRRNSAHIGHIVVVAAEKRRLSAITSLGNMVRQPRNDNTC